MGKEKQNTGKNSNRERWMYIMMAVVAIVLIGAGLLLKNFLDKKKEPEKQVKKETQEEQTEEESYNPLDCVELGKYTGVKVSLKVTKEDLQSEIDSILDEHVIYEQLSGTVQQGDMIYADFEGYVSGQKVDSTCGTDYIEIGSEEWTEGFENSLIGASTGQTAVFSLGIPEGTYGDPAVDGQNVEFHVMVHYICGDEILPEYNNDFVQSISKKYDTVKEYNAHLRKKLKKENEDQKEEFTWADVMEVCDVKKYPEGLLEEARQEVLQGYDDMAEIYGCSREEVFVSFGYESEQDFIDNDLEELAKDTAKEYLVAEAIAAKEGISFTGEDYTLMLEEEYSYVQDQYSTIEAFEADKRNYLENQTRLQSVKKWLSEHAKYKK